MAEDIDWSSHLREADACHEKRLMETARTGSTAQREFATAALVAYQGMVQDGLLPKRTAYGETSYTVQQGLMAAAHGRHDAAAALLIQSAVLRRLDGLRRLAWVALALLVYVAIRVTA